MATEMVAAWSTGPRLVDFAIGLVNSVLKTFEKLLTRFLATEKNKCSNETIIKEDKLPRSHIPRN